MTVQELIDKLRKCKPNRRVVVAGYENGADDVDGIAGVHVQERDEHGWWEGRLDIDDDADELAVIIYGAHGLDGVSPGDPTK